MAAKCPPPTAMSVQVRLEDSVAGSDVVCILLPSFVSSWTTCILRNSFIHATWSDLLAYAGKMVR